MNLEKQIPIKQFVRIIDGEYEGPDFPIDISAIASDSRTIKVGEIFLAIEGKNFDGHDFVFDAFSNGAVAAIVSSDSLLLTSVRLIKVDCPMKALGRLAKYWLEQHPDVTKTCVTGSSGKTTVKELINEFLSIDFTTIYSKGNFNTDLSIPLRSLDVNIDHDHAIFELGARQSGDIKHLSSIIEPDFAVVTNIGHAHLETFGALENTAKVKFELASELKRSGTLVVNADCEHSMKMVSTLQERNIITFGTKGDLSFSNFKNTLNGSSFQISTKWGDAEVKLSLVGKHNAYNFLAAAAVALLNGVDLEELVERASSFTAVTGRMKKVTGMNESIIIDDTYNANPQSVSAAIHYLSEVKADHKIAVLGDMLELGSDSSNYHNEIGALSKKCGVARVLSLGKYSDDINKGFGDLANGYTDKQQLVEDLKNIVSKEKNSAILVKGSRNMNFETIVQELCEEKECLKRS